jgi:hypothetical protein
MTSGSDDSHTQPSRTGATGRAFEFAAAGAGLAFFVAALYYPLLFTNRVLASGDILHYFYPYRDYAAAAFRAWHVPLWNPYIFLGAPFLANPQAAVLYWPHWPLSWLPVTKQIAWSAALHTWLLAMGGYALMRHWRCSAWAGVVAALVLAGSGYVGGLLGHINQMNGAAWLPWATLALDVTAAPGTRTGRWYAVNVRPAILARAVAFGLVIAMMFLAGHTQTLYISMFGLGVWALWPLALSFWRDRSVEGAWAGLRSCTDKLFVFVAGTVLALLVSGAQLLPTLELSALGLRSGGLGYAEASSFSLKPLHLPWTLFPSYGLANLGVVFATSGYTEYVAYVGLLGFALAVLGAWRGRGTARQFGLLMAVMGCFLALGRWNLVYYLLYRIVPGFDLFRAPARWMLLYTLGMAVLAGLGADVALESVRRRVISARHVRWQWMAAAALAGLLAIELVLAARSLPHAHPTAPQAVYDLRTAPAHLITDPARDILGPGAAGRFLSMSTISFDPGDMTDYRGILLGDPETGQKEVLDEAAFEDLIVAFKAQEIVAPNLALLRRIPSIDGFDGGVLPLQRYLEMLTLFIPRDELISDGRLREQIKEVPDTRLLGMLNAQYVITDKVRDLWFEGVYYDRQIGARLGSGGVPAVDVEVPYAFEATYIDVIGYVDAESGAIPGAEWTAATVTALSGDGDRALGAWDISAGNQRGAAFGDGALDSQMAQSSGAVVAYRDVDGGKQEYRARFPLAEPASPTRVVFRHDAGPDVVIRAVTLFDERTGQFVSLVPSDRGRFRRVHSGDVKIYENLDVLPRAYLVDEVIPATDADEALALIGSPEFHPAEAAVVEGGLDLSQRDTAPDSPPGAAEITAYDDARVELSTSSPTDTFLVLSDVNYPGWRATIDGEPVEIHQTDYLFRGVYLPAGDHVVEFAFEPASWRRGLMLTALGICAALALLVWAILARRGRRQASR